MKAEKKRISVKLTEEEYVLLKKIKETKKTGWKGILTGENNGKKV